MKMKSIGASGGVRPGAPASHTRMLAYKHCTWRVQDDAGTVRVGVRETDHAVEGHSTNQYRGTNSSGACLVRPRLASCPRPSALGPRERLRTKNQNPNVQAGRLAS